MDNKVKQETRWVLIGGCFLAFLSAALNAGLFLELGNSVAQMSGEISRLAIELLEDDRRLFGLNVSVTITAFLAGSTLTGYTLHHPTLDKRQPYGRCLMFIGVLLFLAHWTLAPYPRIALALGGFASGFQNAMATHYRGIVLRTTHVTGLVTDVGSHLGMWLRGHRIALWKMWIPTLVTLLFFVGGIAGAWIYMRGWHFLLLLSAAYLIGGSGWYIVQRGILKIGYLERNHPPYEHL